MKRRIQFYLGSKVFIFSAVTKGGKKKKTVASSESKYLRSGLKCRIIFHSLCTKLNKTKSKYNSNISKLTMEIWKI